MTPKPCWNACEAQQAAANYVCSRLPALSGFGITSPMIAGWPFGWQRSSPMGEQMTLRVERAKRERQYDSRLLKFGSPAL